ncbi:MAG: hypothetical protein FRX49_02878 [Trebouxia sp. A1-2]|nr:MAG: hypothetical protein FRX49_02878 [Trebouxia sp. A1-2]
MHFSAYSNRIRLRTIPLSFIDFLVSIFLVSATAVPRDGFPRGVRIQSALEAELEATLADRFTLQRCNGVQTAANTPACFSDMPAAAGAKYLPFADLDVHKLGFINHSPYTLLSFLAKSSILLVVRKKLHILFRQKLRLLIRIIVIFRVVHAATAGLLHLLSTY